MLAACRIGLVEVERDLAAAMADDRVVTGRLRAVGETQLGGVGPRHAEAAELVEGPALGRLERHHQQVVLPVAGVDEDATATERGVGPTARQLHAHVSRLTHGWVVGDVGTVDAVAVDARMARPVRQRTQSSESKNTSFAHVGQCSRFTGRSLAASGGSRHPRPALPGSAHDVLSTLSG